MSKYKGFGCCQQGWLDNSNVRNALRVILKVGTSTRVVMSKQLRMVRVTNSFE